MKEYRFLAEYANYVKRQIKAADMPQEQKKEYQKQTDIIVSRVHHGMITLSDGMMQLAKADAWLVRYNNSTHYGG